MTRTNAAKDLYVRSYLEESGLPVSPQDVFELRLDIERCRMAFTWFDIDSAWNLSGIPRTMSLKHLHTVYPSLVEIDNEAVTNEALVFEIIDEGFSRCARVIEANASYGTPRYGMPVRVHSLPPDEPKRKKLVINSDGTLQPLAENWPDLGLVFGLNTKGSVMLVHHSDTDSVLRLDLSSGVPVTGIEIFSTESAPLALNGHHAGKALVHNSWRDQFGEFVAIGAARHAMTVRVSSLGRILFSNGLRHTFGVDPDGRVWLEETRPSSADRWVLNGDMTLSPCSAQDSVIGYRGFVRLLRRGDARSLQFPALADLWRATVSDEEVSEQAAITPTGPTVLRLASHPGKALSAYCDASEDESFPLEVVDESQACAFFINPDALRCATSGAQIALGIAPTVQQSSAPKTLVG